MTAAVKKIIRSMDEHPDEWELGWGLLTHKRSRLEIWISNGFCFYGIWHNREKIAFSLADKLRMHAALRRWKSK
jgi:hypothetical protein